MGKGPKKVNGQIEFDDELDVEIELETGTGRRMLRKQNITSGPGVGVQVMTSLWRRSFAMKATRAISSSNLPVLSRDARAVEGSWWPP